MIGIDGYICVIIIITSIGYEYPYKQRVSCDDNLRYRNYWKFQLRLPSLPNIIPMDTMMDYV